MYNVFHPFLAISLIHWFRLTKEKKRKKKRKKKEKEKKERKKRKQSVSYVIYLILVSGNLIRLTGIVDFKIAPANSTAIRHPESFRATLVQVRIKIRIENASLVNQLLMKKLVLVKD